MCYTTPKKVEATTVSTDQSTHPVDKNNLTYEQFLDYVKYLDPAAAVTIKKVIPSLPESRLRPGSLINLFAWSSTEMPGESGRDNADLADARYEYWSNLHVRLTNPTNWNAFAMWTAPLSSPEYPVNGKGLTYEQFLNYVKFIDPNAAEIVRKIYLVGTQFAGISFSDSNFHIRALVDMFPWRKTVMPGESDEEWPGHEQMERRYRYWDSLHTRLSDIDNWKAFTSSVTSAPTPVVLPLDQNSMTKEQFFDYVLFVSKNSKLVETLEQYIVKESRSPNWTTEWSIRSLDTKFTWRSLEAMNPSIPFETWSTIHYKLVDRKYWAAYVEARQSASPEPAENLFPVFVELVTKRYFRSPMSGKTRGDLMDAMKSVSFSTAGTEVKRHGHSVYEANKFTVASVTINGKEYRGVAVRNLKDKNDPNLAKVLAVRRLISEYMHEQGEL